MKYMIDRFTLEFERAIYNFRMGGYDAALEPVFNTLALGIANGMKILIPIEPSATDLNLYVPSKEENDLFKTENNTVNHLKSFTADNGKYMIPVFTSEEELNYGDYPDVIVDSMDRLVEAVRFWDGCNGIAVNPHNLAFNLYNELIKIIMERKAQSVFEVVRSGVATMHVGAIVNAANKTLLGGGGVNGAIHRLAGPMLKEECRLFGGCKTGNAVITGSYNINYVDAIIHTVGPVYSGRPKDRVSLANCYLSSLEAASENGISSIAFPCISTGVYGYPLDEAAKVSLMAIIEWFRQHEDKILNVYICCFTDEEYKAYMRVLKNGVSDN